MDIYQALKACLKAGLIPKEEYDKKIQELYDDVMLEEYYG
jgi:hypothetical protein